MNLNSESKEVNNMLNINKYILLSIFLYRGIIGYHYIY